MGPCTHSSANSSSCLDTCGGTAQYEIDGFLYHYHIVGPIGDLVSSPTDPLPDDSMSPYTIGCWKGVPMSSVKNTGKSCASDGYSSSYTAAAVDGVTDIYASNATSTSAASDMVSGGLAVALSWTFVTL